MTALNLNWFSFVGLLGCSLVCMASCSESRKTAPVQGQTPQATKTWALSGIPTKPAKIVVDSGTTFHCNGVPCRLLGLAELDDPQVRAKANDFSKQWFHSVGNYIGIYNDTNPRTAPDGACVTWIRGYDSFLSCLNVELVTAGLAKVDYSSDEGYEFVVPGKDDDYQETWRQQLDEAEGRYARGDELRVLFDWPIVRKSVTREALGRRSKPHQ